jgi:hypothetical protein
MSTSNRGRLILTTVFLLAAIAAVAAWMYLRTRPSEVVHLDVAAPSDFGGTVRSTDLARVFDAAVDGSLNGMSLAIDFGSRDRRPVFTIGDAMRLTVSAGEPARCALFHRSARGAFRLFHPEAGPGFPLTANQRWDSGPLRAAEPTGTESFLLICRSDGSSDLNLTGTLQRPRGEWRKVFSALRADFEVRP